VAAKKAEDSGVITVRTVLTGTTALLMHNERLADPDNEWTQRIAAITGKGTKQTAVDRAEKARLEFLGGLYTDGGKVVVPKANILKCIAEGSIGVLRNYKSTIFRAVSNPDPAQLGVQLVFPGVHKPPEELAGEPKYLDRSTVRNSGPTGGRVVRVRPRFDPWGLSVDWTLITSVLDYDKFAKFVKAAGRIEGLGDKRIKGYGRFDAEVIKVGEAA